MKSNPEKVPCAAKEIETDIPDLDVDGKEQYDVFGNVKTKKVAKIYQLIENINANKAIIETVYSKSGKTNNIQIKNTLDIVNQANITKLEVARLTVKENFKIINELISEGTSDFNNVKFENEADFNKTITIQNTTDIEISKEIKGDIDVAGDINITGEYDLNNLVISGNLNVSGDTNLSNATINGEIWSNNITTNSVTTGNMTIEGLIESISMKAKKGDFDNINIELRSLKMKVNAKCQESRVICKGSL